MGSVNDQPVGFLHNPRGVKRRSPSPLEKPERHRPWLRYDTGEDEDEDMDEDVDDAHYLADAEDNVDMLVCTSASCPMILGQAPRHIQEPIGRSTEPITVTVIGYGYNDTHITVHLINGKKITKARAHRQPYIASLGLSRDILRDLDQDPHWNAQTFQTELLNKAGRKIMRLDTRQQWVVQQLIERAHFVRTC
jgi:hypothetical protein